MKTYEFDDMDPATWAEDPPPDPFIRRLIAVAICAVYLMAGYAVFILGKDSALTAILLSLTTTLGILGGWSYGKTKKE